MGHSYMLYLLGMEPFYKRKKIIIFFLATHWWWFSFGTTFLLCTGGSGSGYDCIIPISGLAFLTEMSIFLVAPFWPWFFYLKLFPKATEIVTIFGIIVILAVSMFYLS